MRILNLRLSLIVIVVFIAVSTIAEDALDQWYLRDARVVSKVRFVGGLFIGVGGNGRILTSPDGQTWIARNSGTTANLTGIAFGGIFPNPTGYVVVGANATILFSPDAISWTPVITTNTCDLNDVVFGGLNFIAVTTRQTINQPNALLTQNATNWTPIIFPNAAPGQFGNFRTHSLVTIGNVFIAAGSASIVSDIWRSNGGSIWQNVGNSGQAIQGIASGNGRVIAIGIEGSPAVSTNNGNGWFIPATNLCANSFICHIGNDITFGNGTFVCVRGPVKNGPLVTTNGVNWNHRSALTNLDMNSVAFGNGTFVAAGANGIYQSEPVSTPGLSISKHSSSNVLNITVAGEVGRAYRLQTSTNLSNWFDHSSFTNTLPSIDFIEPITNTSQLFYRAVTP